MSPATLSMADMATILVVALAALSVILSFIVWRARQRIAWLEDEEHQLRSANHALELELATLQATQGERYRAFEQMKEELQISRDRLKAEFEHLASQVLQQREQHFQISNR